MHVRIRRRLDPVLVHAFAVLVAFTSLPCAAAKESSQQDRYVNCSNFEGRTLQEAEFMAGPTGDKANSALPEWLPYNILLLVLAFMMGLGKGGVPGSSTSSVAINSLYAPDGCLDLATALQVPVTGLADCAVVLNFIRNAKWGVILKLLPPTGAGVALGSQLVGQLSAAQAKLLIGSILSGILLLNLSQELMARKKVKKDDDAAEEKPPWYAESFGFVCLIGVTGGFATILTNSMGPMLNVFLLTLKLEPKAFVGTRATFFCTVNFVKIAQRLYFGTLSIPMLVLGSKYGLMSVLGVFVAKILVSRMSKSLFMKLEYCVMSYAASKLLYAGISG
eukprot:gnl/TRDRNA2_/TRDRNA2_81017_c0_seq1.p1 gnl/TRDRNA2_/TRDRNA2_81017_c0~~gnl/TRDRNA2_/TRDRNA2_81017_c0_seq1.p1  ORF type:complete len:334 (+),score=64.38 gnl/TRDRNA2_/TRDRNA2_81017_c0_seq1:79-1080(+)